MVLLFFCQYGWSQTATLSLSPAQTFTGATIPLTLSLSGAPVATLQWTMSYSTADFTALFVTAGPAAAAAGKSIACYGPAGYYTCLLTGINANSMYTGVVAVASLTSAPSLLSTPASRVSTVAITSPKAASLQADGIQVSSSNSAVTILNGPPSQVTPSTVSLGASQQQQFTSDTMVTWSISPPVGTITSSGLYTAPAMISSAQTVTVRAAGVLNPSISATATVYLNPATVTVSPASATLTASQTKQFTAAVTDTTNTAVTWSLSPAVGTISPSGLYAAPTYLASSQIVTVKATSLADPMKFGNATVALNPSAVPQPGGLVAYWPFDEGGGATAADGSGNQNNAVLQGATWMQSGKSGSAVDFDGANSYVDAGLFDVPGTAITISAWFKADDFPPYNSPRIISKATGLAESDHYFMLAIHKQDSNALRFQLKTGGVTRTLFSSSGTMSVGRWVHAVATYDGVMLRLYQDGFEVGSMPASGAIATDSTVPVWIGRNPKGGEAFDGMIDQVRIYNRALTPTEINSLYQTGQ